LLVNLDAHPDRTLGARALDSTVVAHQKTAQVFRNRSTIFKGQSIETGAAWESYGDAIGMRWAPPDITFTQKMSLFWGGPEISLEHRPGPTPGAIWVVIPKDKTVFVGDTVVVDQPPFLANADMQVWIDSLVLLQSAYADYTVISGRGGAAAMEIIRAQQQFLRSVVKSLDRLAQRNAPSEATEELVPGLLKEFSMPPDRDDLYRQRLRYGLYQYYSRFYRSVNPQEPDRIENGEQ
jgi:glyoxylase-like metal-dependent hydrolase (beta-lactamase superfamily II)